MRHRGVPPDDEVELRQLPPVVNLVGDEILTGAVALHNGRHHVLRHIGIVGQKLLGVLGEAVAAIAERRVVIVFQR